MNNEVIFKLANSSRLGPEYTRPGSSIIDRTSCLFSTQVMISKKILVRYIDVGGGCWRRDQLVTTHVTRIKMVAPTYKNRSTPSTG